MNEKEIIAAAIDLMRIDNAAYIAVISSPRNYNTSYVRTLNYYIEKIKEGVGLINDKQD